MTDWLLDTLIWTAALIALVLVLRRPVARWFGPQAAYALWALPLLRLALPPLQLPSWMAPEKAAPLPEAGADMMVVLVEPAAAAPMSDAAEPLISALLFDIAIALWLLGAAVFLVQRFRAYRQMRMAMLAGSREVGRAGRVRLVETPATSAPLAFGVIDKVVALPVGFLAAWDREARDLALAHELAHHRGHDLLINMAVQPLFALHWFNPLGHLGWMALRRDQEAACDARVVAAASPEVRATYARVIASFAAGPSVALAAPMACPVLGEKSIIHRLRSITMNNPSRRQQWLGRGLMAGALVALPLTATISYADAPPEVPAPPAPPAPPAAPGAPPAPAAPEAPAAPAAPDADFAWGEDVQVNTSDDGKIRTVVLRKTREGEPGPGEKHETRVVWIGDKQGQLSAEEKAEMEREIRAAMEESRREADVARREADREMRLARREADREMAQARREIRLAFKDMESARGEMVQLDFDCDGALEVSEDKGAKGPRKVVLCKSDVMTSALAGLKAAREAIAKDGSMSDEIRAEVLRSLDEEIRNWKNDAK
ncbi:hypothetical protein G6N82_00230 [Altererythrobacter sp. BO-6]|uniref:M56 family metallopeptidase n=1 Tax=Altererythrobacter sp. BO-6 TaxID=2604537 RepID=UPI0013E1F609|nr:M56 family metallopeptidase [Altererythrobacter sp. BO-6]QIG52795.1 hypothetical protein G6N82_00230 [Altererythrobacter sp. BO-6]